LRDYAEHASVQGLIYLTFSYQTKYGKLFWIWIVLFMLALGIYWSKIFYNDWQGQQVLTTIATTAYPVHQIEFPAVTFCSPGVNVAVTDVPLMKQFFTYLADNYNISINTTAYAAVQLMNQVLKSVFL
jgi:hypothetical protein